MNFIKTLLLFSVFSFLSCTNSNDKDGKKTAGDEYEINKELKPSGEPVSDAEKEERINTLIADSKKTLDSIDGAYSFIRRQSRVQALSLDEREQVNEALIELNDAKDLIVLQMEKNIINDLKEKTTSLQAIMEDMNTKSEKLLHIARTLSRISGIISKTTNLLAGALTIGIIRPPLPPGS